MKTQMILLLIIISLSLTNAAMSYPIPPRSLRRLVLDSDLVIVARVLKTEEAKQEDEFWHNGKATLRVSSVLKGTTVSPTISVYYSPNMICPAPARYENDKTVLAFLNPRQNGDGFKTYALSYGAISLSVDDMKIYRARIKELLAIEKEPDVDRRNKQTTEWLVKCAEHSATHWDGLHGLQGALFRTFMKGEKPKEEPAFLKLLTNKQKQRLLTLLKTLPNGSEMPKEEPALFWPLPYEEKQRLFPNAVDKKNYYPGMLMSILEESEKLRDISSAFYKIVWTDPNKSEKQKTIVAMFIKEFEKLSKMPDKRKAVLQSKLNEAYEKKSILDDNYGKNWKYNFEEILEEVNEALQRNQRSNGDGN